MAISEAYLHCHIGLTSFPFEDSFNITVLDQLDLARASFSSLGTMGATLVGQNFPNIHLTLAERFVKMSR